VIIETDDGHRIALSGDGQAAPRPRRAGARHLRKRPPLHRVQGLCLGQ
jgi:hypothetical protein